MNNKDLLTEDQGQELISQARQALEDRIRQGKIPSSGAALQPVDERLLENGATFVTLTIGGMLRGCIGSPEAHAPLIEDVRENAVRAALFDPRFPPVVEKDLDRIQIEVSVLTAPRLLDCPPVERSQRIRPGIDGLLLTSAYNRGLLLPQVWDKIPEPVDFLRALCHKAGLSANGWQQPETKLYTFQVQAFHEELEKN
ncbi:MAG: AmmeMemoRadiSam system protein A [Anaerolineales bacterium]|nr:AmmeMemoRadiSam system protein A [Anaerolineales bacterium]